MQLADWRSLFDGGRQPLIGMVHLGALPGSPGFDRGGGMSAVVDAAGADVDVLVGAGFDAVLFVNESDVPYPDAATQAGVAALTAVVARTAPVSIPFGVEFLFDAGASLACAIATGAAFIRGGVIGAWETTSGVRFGGAASLMRDRAALGAEHVGVFSVAQAEMAFALSPVMLADRVRTAAREKAMDVVLLGGSLPGVPVDTALVASVRSAVGDMPVLANSGVRSTTVAAMLAAFDGCLVGSDLKRDAILHNPVDPGRAAAFLAGIR